MSKSNYGPDYWKTIRTTTGQQSKKGKTRVRITLPAGEGFKLLNMAEISSPGGATISLSLPFPMGEAGLGKITESLSQVGGTVEIIQE